MNFGGAGRGLTLLKVEVGLLVRYYISIFLFIWTGHIDFGVVTIILHIVLVKVGEGGLLSTTTFHFFNLIFGDVEKLLNFKRRGQERLTYKLCIVFIAESIVFYVIGEDDGTRLIRVS